MVRKYCFNCDRETKHHVKNGHFTITYECTVCATPESVPLDNCVAYPNEVESADPKTEQVPTSGTGISFLRFFTGK